MVYLFLNEFLQFAALLDSCSASSSNHTNLLPLFHFRMYSLVLIFLPNCRYAQVICHCTNHDVIHMRFFTPAIDNKIRCQSLLYFTLCEFPAQEPADIPSATESLLFFRNRSQNLFRCRREKPLILNKTNSTVQKKKITRHNHNSCSHCYYHFYLNRLHIKICHSCCLTKFFIVLSLHKITCSLIIVLLFVRKQLFQYVNICFLPVSF